MTNEYVLMSELQQPLYSSQEKDLFKKNHQEGPAATPAPYRKKGIQWSS
jgi:hypothetical protein